MLVYAIESEGLTRALDYIEGLVPVDNKDDKLVRRCSELRLVRSELADSTIKRMVSTPFRLDSD